VSKVAFVHLSDIHFSHATVGGEYDLDADLRNELERDAITVRKTLDVPMTGVLVTGDVAYAGKQKDYQAAAVWLGRFCSELETAQENVWTVPGNHDVDRDAIRGSGLLQRTHAQIRGGGPLDSERILKECLEEKIARSMLFTPLANYNDFASKFGCAIGLDRLNWEHDVTLNDGSTLRVLGLTSTTISNELDDAGANKLILGAAQTSFPRQEGVEYVTLCHHPPQWLIDQDNVEEVLSARVPVQLFGHKHHQRIDKINDSLRITAGAMHPDRDERTWTPRYNFLLFQVNATGAERNLEVEVIPRVWNETERRFVADRDPANGSEKRRIPLRIKDWRPPATPTTALPQRPESGEDRSPRPMDQATIRGGQQMDPARRLTYRFLSLPYHIRLEVAQELGLLLDEDKDTSDPELFKRFFRRASEKGVLRQLWAAVERKHGPGDALPNPFVER
jgi:predicted phosphodiesterase